MGGAGDSEGQCLNVGEVFQERASRTEIPSASISQLAQSIRRGQRTGVRGIEPVGFAGRRPLSKISISSAPGILSPGPLASTAASPPAARTARSTASSTSPEGPSVPFTWRSTERFQMRRGTRTECRPREVEAGAVALQGT